MQTRQPCWDRAEAAVDRRDGPAREVSDHCRYHYRDDASRHTPGYERPPVECSESQCPDGQRLPVDAVEIARKRDDLLRHVSRHFETEPKKLIQLSAEDDDGNAAGESRHDRVGEELEQPPHPQRAEKNQHHARHHRGEREPTVAIYCDNGKQDGHKRPCWPRDLKPRAAQQRHYKARDDSGPETLLRRDARSDPESNRQRKRD